MAYEKRFRATARDGEKFLISHVQPTKKNLRDTIEPTTEELARSGVCVATDGEWGFKINGATHKSTTAVCKAVLNRNGETNEWRGPKHLFIFRDDAWRSYSSLESAEK